MAITADWVVVWMKECQTIISEKREELIDLDRAIGDADHGENLDRGFSAVVDVVTKNDYDTPSAVLKAASMSLMSSVGGAYGPLLGTAFLRGATTSANKESLDAADVVEIIKSAVEGIKARGRAELKDKTMLDAWIPAQLAAAEKASEGGSILDTLKAAAEGAATGAKATKELEARKGRASYLGERSIGHIDPGAQSTAYILDAAVKAAESMDV